MTKETKEWTPAKEGEVKCDCCGWDDYGYQHEPFCAIKTHEYEDTALEAMQQEERLFLTSLADEQSDRDEET